MTTGPENPAAAGLGRLRAGHADREQVIEMLKNAFIHGRLTRDELDARAGRAITARTYAELAALTADIPDIPDIPAAAGPASPSAPARRGPLVRAAAGAGSCLVIAVAAVWVAGLADPGGPGPDPYHSWARLCLFVAFSAVVTALCIVINGVGTAVEQRRSGGQLPPRPGPGGYAPDGDQRGRAGHGEVSPGPRPDQTQADVQAHKSRQRRPHLPARAGRAPRGVRPASGAV